MSDSNRRNRYMRMSPDDLAAGLEAVGMTVSGFAYVSGANERRIKQWLAGEEDIAPYVPILLSLLTLPGAVGLAMDVANFYLEEAA